MVGVVVLVLRLGLKFSLRRVTFYTNSDRCGFAVAFSFLEEAQWLGFYARCMWRAWLFYLG